MCRLATRDVISALRDGDTRNYICVSLQKLLLVFELVVIDYDCRAKRVKHVNAIWMLDKPPVDVSFVRKIYLRNQ